MSPDATALVVAPAEGGAVIRVKVVPGSSRTRLAGLLGDRLKISVAAPAEGGKANAALCKLLAAIFQVPSRQVTVTAGHAQPQKTVLLAGLTVAEAARCLRQCLEP